MLEPILPAVRMLFGPFEALEPVAALVLFGGWPWLPHLHRI